MASTYGRESSWEAARRMGRKGARERLRREREAKAKAQVLDQICEALRASNRNPDRIIKKLLKMFPPELEDQDEPELPDD